MTTKFSALNTDTDFLSVNTSSLPYETFTTQIINSLQNEESVIDENAFIDPKYEHTEPNCLNYCYVINNYEAGIFV